MPVEARPSSHDRRAAAEQPVAVQLPEVAEDAAQVVRRIGALGVPRHLDPLHRRETPVDLNAQFGELLLERLELLRHVHGPFARDAPQLLDLALELQQGTFEVERVGRHRQVAPFQPVVPEPLERGRDSVGTGVAFTSCTRSAPSSSRSAASRSSATATRSERLRSRAWVPFPPYSSSTGAGPGCEAHSAATARATSGGGGSALGQRSAIPIAPLSLRSSSGRAAAPTPRGSDDAPPPVARQRQPASPRLLPRTN